MVPTLDSLDIDGGGPKYIRLLSDAHLEFSVGSPANTRKLFEVLKQILPIFPTDRETVLVLAGDISSYKSQLEDLVAECSARFHSVILVDGNHEHYGNDIRDWKEFAEKLESPQSPLGNNVYVSRVDTVQCIQLMGVRFIIHALWCDPSDGNRVVPPLGFSDFVYIKDSAFQGRLGFDTMSKIHSNAKEGIFEALKDPYPGKTVVVTHHAPLWNFSDPKYGKDSISHMFIGDCHKEILNCETPADLWLFGHTHYPIDEAHLGTRFVNNPVGYPGEPDRVRMYQPTLLIPL